MFEKIMTNELLFITGQKIQKRTREQERDAEQTVNEKFTVAQKKWISMPKMDIQWISNGYPFHT